MSIVAEFDPILEDEINDEGDVLVATVPVWAIGPEGIKVERVIRQF